ncbi:unnamed protein product, partial [Symbiodinium necroappetens]
MQAGFEKGLRSWRRSWAREALSEWAVEPRRTLDYALCIYDRQAAGKAAKAATPTSGREAWVAWLPQFHTWPVFYTNRREAVVALSVQWPDETWTKLSAEVREILDGSIAGDRRQALHPDLLPLTALPGPMLQQAPTVEIEGASPQD